MVVSPFVVVLDANVLFPFVLRDTLLRAAEAELYAPRWSERILDEARRNLVATGRMTEAQAGALVSAMATAFPEALVDGFDSLIDAMPNDEGDRHVAAAAVKAGAQVIVTSNLRDFANLPEGIEAQSPDEFLCGLDDLAPDTMIRLLREQATALTKPTWTVDDLLVRLRRTAPTFGDRVLARNRAPNANLEAVAEMPTFRTRAARSR